MTSHFGFHTINEYPCHGLFSLTCFAFLCFFLVTSLFKMAPKHSAEMLPGVPNGGKAMKVPSVEYMEEVSFIWAELSCHWPGVQC